MRFLFSFLVIVLTLAFFITAVIYLLKRAFSDWTAFRPDSAVFQDVLHRLRRCAKEYLAELVPWDGEMFSLLSLRQSRAPRRSECRNAYVGYLLSIFQEPVVLYCIQKVGKHKVVLARTHDREFVFRQKEKAVDVWLNGAPLGVFSGNALLSAGKEEKVLAELREKPSEVHSELLLPGGNTVSLTNQERALGPNPRAAMMVKALETREEDVALALVLLRLLVLGEVK